MQNARREKVELPSYRLLPFIHIITSPGKFRNADSVDQERSKLACSSLWGNEEGTGPEASADVVSQLFNYQRSSSVATRGASRVVE
jgi:hypothetical protein